MSFGWIGDKVRLVPLEREKHLENCVRWLNDPHVTEWTLMGDFPMTRGAEEDYFARVSLEPRTDVGFAIETLEEEHIGVCAISRIDYRHGFGTEGIIIGRHPTLAARLRLGTRWRSLTRYGFDVLGLRILLAIAFPENVASLKSLGQSRLPRSRPHPPTLVETRHLPRRNPTRRNQRTMAGDNQSRIRRGKTRPLKAGY